MNSAVRPTPLQPKFTPTATIGLALLSMRSILPPSPLPCMSQPTDRHTIYDRQTAKPRAFRGILFELYRWMCIAFLKLGGWKIEGDFPSDRKFVLVAAPHTANLDGFLMVAAAGYYRAIIRWMGKKSLTTGPFGWLVKLSGCIPIDRSAKHDVVEQMRQAFEAETDLIVLVPPEGTRSRTEGWKSGFYHIAHNAGVPIVMSVLDYKTRTIRMSGIMQPTGDYDADLPVIQSHYLDAVAKYPDKFNNE